MQSTSTRNDRGDGAIKILIWESFAFLLRFEDLIVSFYSLSYLYFFNNLFYNCKLEIIISYLITLFIRHLK